MGRLLVVFLDGVGIGPDDADLNPFLRAELPVLRHLLGGRVPVLGAPDPRGATARAFPVDATLGTEGLPQSGTGQVALFTGLDAPRLFGRHFGPWVPVRLRPLLEAENFLRKAVDRGARVVFANAFPARALEARSLRRVPAPPLAARAAGLLARDHEALARGEAVASQIGNEEWRRHFGLTDLPKVSAVGAGETLARLAAGADLTFFAHYATDVAGHREGMAGAVAALERVDRFFGGILGALQEDIALLVVSDHGNIEDVRGGHTRNPALGLVVGDAELAPRSLTEIAPAVLDHVFGG